MVLEKTLGSSLDCKEIKPVNSKDNQSWMFIGRTDAEAENPILLVTWWEELTHWERLWCWVRLKVEEGDDRGWDGWMVSLTWWHDFEQALGVGDAQGSLVCCSPWGHKESDTTEQMNWKPLSQQTKTTEDLVTPTVDPEHVGFHGMAWHPEETGG